MAGRNRIDTFKRDNLIVNILKQHEGIKNAIKSTELAKQLCERGYRTKSESLHMMISKIIYERNLPIISSSSWGYCWGTNKEDFQVSIVELQNKVNELNNRINHLKKFVID